jgi:hypothetical protein
VIREKINDHESLLSGWFHERQQQLQVSLARTIQNGSLCTQGDTWKFALIKLICWFLQLIPLSRRIIEKGPRAEGMIRYKWQKGLPFVGDANGGISLPQVYCAPVSPSMKHLGVSFTDDEIFRKGKKGIFQLVVLLKNLSELGAAREALSGLEKLQSHFVIPQEATFIVQTSKIEVLPADVGSDVFRLATADEFLSTESLCKFRPAPQYYNMYQMRESLHGSTFVIVRPDRVIYAACKTAEQLKRICDGIPQILGLL